MRLRDIQLPGGTRLHRLWILATAGVGVAATVAAVLIIRLAAPAPASSPAATPYPLAKLIADARRASAAAPAGIVRAAGTHLVLDGAPWRFIGFNDYELTSQSYSGYTCGGEHSDAEVDADFAQMHKLGVTVVRTWFFQSYIAGRDWSAFDRVLNDAAHYGMRVIPVLSNQTRTCENYNYSSPEYKNLSWYQAGYRTDLQYGMPLSYRNYAISVAHHYAGDTRIAVWQLMNEAEAATSPGGRCDESAASKALRSFADDMAVALKRADPFHLVSLGTIGGNQCGTDGPDYQFVHAGAIDLCEQHDYTATPQAAPRINPCLALHKPMFIGERGFPADLGSGTPTDLTLATRAAYVKTDIENIFADDCCDGYLLWSWSSGPSVSYDIGSTDPVGPVIAELARRLANPAAVYATILNAMRAHLRLQSDY